VEADGAPSATLDPERAERPDPAAVDPSTYLHERYHRARLRGAALRTYYALKPLFPRALQLAVRRRYARRQALRTFPAWPIEPLLVDHRDAQLRLRLQASGSPSLPLVNYWPDGRRFAAVLTHDVEAAAGIERIGPLLELERRHDLVSSWNFVAEDYPIPDGTFEMIRAAGGEIGVHGVTHDGKLFDDRRSFEVELAKIHRYLQDWNAVGFRSPATRRNADWMPELGCLYDSSFPDTDPFEPQPGGCCSIHPFFLGDLVELPITLTQDHTLWEILRQPSIDLWRRKSDWLIAHGGLINLIVHPDYVTSPERLELYDEFLGYLRERLDADRGWHALPREVASWWRAREGFRIAGAAGAEHIEGENGAHGYLGRATVARAHEHDGAVSIDP
jgi:peptidoglycan/xylan/chitin deacetylase (PgdA/CDA1 family)